MRRVVELPVDNTVPLRQAVLRALGVPGEFSPDERTVALVEDGIRVYRDLAQPVGLLMDISVEDFTPVYFGTGNNAEETPLGNIYESSNGLALFAVTVGERICDEIAHLFDKDDFALGAAVDATASEGTEMAAQAMQSRYNQYLQRRDSLDQSKGILAFSPGYCGWHISAQGKLFEYLDPGEVGISLLKSYLMQPIKSISGVIVFGRISLFDFDDSFPFCSECDERSCRERISKLVGR
jgi:hypothetical protein